VKHTSSFVKNPASTSGLCLAVSEHETSAASSRPFSKDVKPNLMDHDSMFDGSHAAVGQDISPYWLSCSPNFAVEQQPPLIAHAMN
jgi:hypothetical protein